MVSVNKTPVLLITLFFRKLNCLLAEKYSLPFGPSFFSFLFNGFILRPQKSLKQHYG